MRPKFILARLFGVLLLLMASVLAFIWFVWLAPEKHLSSGAWTRDHSQVACWNEMQKSIHRLGANHYSSIVMGYYGDKAWTEWLVRELYSSKTDTEPRSCDEWPFHLDDAIINMTNQRMTNATGWLTWWETNKNKSQCEWIRQGFAQKGLLLQQPLTTNNIIELLKLANHSTNSIIMANKISSDLASALRYNALRWLRDSGFRAKDFDLTGLADQDRQELTAALIAYSEWYGIHQNYPGRLQITGNIPENSLRDNSILSPKLRWPLYAAILALAFGGGVLLRKSAAIKTN